MKLNESSVQPHQGLPNGREDRLGPPHPQPNTDDRSQRRPAEETGSCDSNFRIIVQ